MLPNIGITEAVILLFIVLLLFGAKRLPEIGGSLGKGIREFKNSVKEVGNEVRGELEDADDSHAERNRDED
ncbi:MAG TPA: twin-arginine translocase TatA/TatE family subunit [Gemmatimonadota bacterium]|nr:twin-arginine translocase TatA/TatE family subunit [Gemmatimonadota bacterium]